MRFQGFNPLGISGLQGRPSFETVSREINLSDFYEDEPGIDREDDGFMILTANQLNSSAPWSKISSKAASLEEVDALNIPVETDEEYCARVLSDLPGDPIIY